MRESLFGKRESTTPNSPLNTSSSIVPGGSGGGVTSTMKTASFGVAASQAAPAASINESSSVTEGGSKLIVGPDIKLKGVEITDCATLVVEGRGRVEASIDSGAIQIAESGTFKGSAQVDIAEIRGEFDGDLTVRQKLVIYSTGKVSGSVRYGKVVIEEGGQLSGNIQMGTAAPAAKSLSVAKVS